jgi:predicted PurR-regulated permease PerM
MTRLVSFAVLLGILLIVSILFYQVMSNFLLPLFLAALVVVVFEPLHRWLSLRCGGRKHLAAGLTTLVVALLALLPTVVVVTLGVSEGLAFRRGFDAHRAQLLLARIRHKSRLELPFPDQLPAVEDLLRSTVWEEAGPRRMEKVDELHNQVATIVSGIATIEGERLTLPRDMLQGRGDEVLKAIQEFRQTLDGPGDSENDAARVAALANVDQRFHELRRDLCGGTIRAWAIDFVNPPPERAQELRQQLAREVSDAMLPVANATSSFVAQMAFSAFIMLVAIYFFFADGEAMTAGVMRLIPLDLRHQHELLNEFGVISRAVVLATLLSALAQGLLTGIGLWFVGIESVIFLTVLAVLFALVPFVGAMAVWLPACLWLLIIEDRTGAAVGLAIYGMLIVGQADNVVKPLMLRGRSNVHPLLALLSILGGVQVLGAIGILVGPMLVVFLQTLLKILHREMTSFESGPAAGTSARRVPRAKAPGRSSGIPLTAIVIPSPSMRGRRSGIIRQYVRPQ